MSSDEEYLDDLLKSFIENEDESNHLAEEKEDSESTAGTEEADVPVDFDKSVDDSDALDNEFAIEDFAIEEPELEELNEGEEAEIAKEAEADFEDEFSLNDFAIQEPAPDELHMEDIKPLEEEKRETEEAAEEDIDIMSPEDIDRLFAIEDTDSVMEEIQADNGDSGDAELAEISGLMNSGNGDSVDDDMLALLESMSADMEETGFGAEQTEAHDISENTMAETSDIEEAEEKKEKKGLFSKLFGKKNKEKEGEKETADESAVQEDELLINPEENKDTEDENTEPVKEKKQNFFTRFLSFLTETDDGDEMEKLKAEHGMEPSDENKNILEELDAEDKNKKKKKVKSKEGKDETDPEGDEEVAIKDTKKKKKKDKKVKAESENILAETKPEKKISKKNIFIITGLCITLTAVVVVLCSIVPAFFEKRAAREAYYSSDYAKSYELLYGKKLDNSDTIIYNKSKIILELNRKLASYHNYISMGKEVQALDALMSGIRKYPDIYKEAEEYHVTQEVSAIYETILNILNDRYSMSEAVAKVINDYEDDLLYTKKLESIAYGTPFAMPEEGTAGVVTDVLPEEQDLIEDKAQPETAESGIMQNEMPEAAEEETIQIPLEEELPLSTGSETEQEQVAEPEEVTQIPEVEEMQETPAEPETGTNSSNNSQGELIQGIRQPINIEIRGN